MSRSSMNMRRVLSTSRSLSAAGRMYIAQSTHPLLVRIAKDRKADARVHVCNSHSLQTYAGPRDNCAAAALSIPVRVRIRAESPQHHLLPRL